MTSYGLEDIRHLLPAEHELVGEPDGKRFTNVRPAHEADPDSLVWINPNRADKQEILEGTRAGMVVADPSLDPAAVRDKLVILVPSPKLTFSAIVSALFGPERPSGIHPSAVVDPEAEVGSDVHLGPFTYVGKASIGDGSVVHGNCHIHDGVRIGRNVVIQAGCVIGGEGFSFERDEEGRLHKFPHVGGVVIEDDVEIQVLTNVDRGTLGDTIIRRGAKIDTFCHIAHNCDIGEDTMVVAHAMLGGSLKVGRRCWLGPATVFRDGLSIGDDAYVGLGALVVKDVEPGAHVMGAPARDIEEYKEQLRQIRRLGA
jgi:UDP-3-O-[3-hydroxymyristoyl] glucosamine N-acyltransferase